MKKASRTTLRIVLLGPQGSGKGTQAALLARQYKLPHISTGEIFRHHLKYRTSLGRKVAKLLDAGKLVPDRLTNTIIRERLRHPDVRRGYILDGYPRTLPQAKFLNTIAPPAYVLALELSDRAAVIRLSGRRMAPDGRIYHLKFNPPPVRLRRQVVQRDDDRPASVRRRLKIYRRETSPLLRFYKTAGVLRAVDARWSIARVHQNLRRILTTSRQRSV